MVLFDMCLFLSLAIFMISLLALVTSSMMTGIKGITALVYGTNCLYPFPIWGVIFGALFFLICFWIFITIGTSSPFPSPEEEKVTQWSLRIGCLLMTPLFGFGIYLTTFPEENCDEFKYQRGLAMADVIFFGILLSLIITFDLASQIEGYLDKRARDAPKIPPTKVNPQEISEV